MSETAAPDALTASIASTEPVICTITLCDKEFPVVRKPSSLLLAELARAESTDDPEAIAVLADFFEFTLGDSNYRTFKRHAMRAGADDDALREAMKDVLEGTLGRPTE